MNTLLAVALHPIEVVQRCPVLARSILSLDMAGMPVFIAVGNRLYYSLNLVIAGELSAWGGFFFQASNTELTFGALVVFSLITCDFKGWIEITFFDYTSCHHQTNE
jgi:hypothetical protein